MPLSPSSSDELNPKAAATFFVMNSIESKESFKVAKFLQSVCKDKDMDFKRVQEQYKDFTYKFQDELQRDYDEQCGFKTKYPWIKDSWNILYTR